MRTLSHYTITTGHNRMSPRSEVGIDAIVALTPMLTDGHHPMPGFPDYQVRVTATAGLLAATVSRGKVPLVTTFVATDDAGLQAALRVTGCIPAIPITLPAALVDVHATASGDKALDWLGDFERCLAWAWIEKQDSP